MQPFPQTKQPPLSSLEVNIPESPSISTTSFMPADISGIDYVHTHLQPQGHVKICQHKSSGLCPKIADGQ